MPIGVPKVPFLLPEDEDATWVDVYNVLYRKRVLFLGGEISADNANTIVAIIVYLSIEDKNLDQHIFLNSHGGSLPGGLAIYDIMQVVQPTIQTIAVGIVASMASVILLGGTTSRRIALANSRVMMHQPATGFFMAPVTNLLKEVRLMREVREIVVSIYAQRTTKPFGIIWADLERDLYMSAREAKDYGIVDFVGVTKTNPNPIRGLKLKTSSDKNFIKVNDSEISFSLLKDPDLSLLKDSKLN
uniref:ATP-dependent Clp protease proteolytic subunit n=1 Tax=Valerianella locusta TaxID=59166 RepID=UPI0021ABEA8C|nr:ATP-dependent Clp protease proteolytic subunit [Valerianella locusta]UUL71524.1 ATP-dependent Clp protease proteolytic subunit [Valerianella locusta]